MKARTLSLILVLDAGLAVLLPLRSAAETAFGSNLSNRSIEQFPLEGSGSIFGSGGPLNAPMPDGMDGMVFPIGGPLNAPMPYSMDGMVFPIGAPLGDAPMPYSMDGMVFANLGNLDGTDYNSKSITNIAPGGTATLFSNTGMMTDGAIVPEPGSAALLLCGVPLLALRQRRP